MAARKPQDSLRSRVRDLLGGRVRRDASNETIQGEKAATEKNGLAEPPSYDEIASDDRKLDPIVRNTHHNHLRSPLVRLPDALLVRLMSALDLDTLLTLRHTSRDFMRLFSTEPVFAKHHLDAFPEQGRWTYTALVWAPPSDAFPRQAAHRPGSWCSACLERHPETPSLYCSLCKTSLEGACFSEFARHESFTDADRICLGHQLALRVCEHTALHYQQLRHMGTRGGAMDHACRPPRSVEGRRCTAARCRDGKTGIQCYKREGSGGTMQLEVGSSVHIKFKRLPSGGMCPASIRGELAAARGMGRGVGRQWMAGGRCFPWVDPMRAFDPNVCDCVEWVPAGAASGSHARWQAARAAAGGNGGARRDSAVGDEYTSAAGRCASRRHGFDAVREGVEVSVDFVRCPVYDDMLVLRQTVSCRVDPEVASGPGWGHLAALAAHRPGREGDSERCGDV